MKPFSVSYNQKVRIINTMLAALGGVLLTLVLIYAATHNLLLIGETPLIFALSLFWVVNFGIILTIYSGLNRHFKDPALSKPQMLWAASSASLAMMITDGLEASFYLLILLPMVFGVFRTTVTQFRLFTAYALSISLAVILVRHYLLKSDTHLSHSLISWCTFIFCALILASICKSIVNLQLRLRDKNLQLENALQARNNFLANINHELRIPMNGVLNLLEKALLQNGNNELKSTLTTAHSSGTALLSVINDILDAIKIEPGNIVPYPHRYLLPDVLDETLQSFTAACHHKNLYLELHLNEHIPTEVYGDSSKLRQILNNLISNAIKFTDRGGISIYVSARPIVNPEHPNEVELRFTIKDTGIGIAPEKITHLFESLDQTDPQITPPTNTQKSRSVGLGLPIAHNLCELMGGEIRVESQPGEGSTFFFQIKVLEIPPSHRKSISIE